MSSLTMAPTITVIGGGVMATALIAGMLKSQTVTPDQIRCTEPLAARRDALANEFGITALADNVLAVAGADVVILAVKPQVIHAVLAGMTGKLPPESLLLSIAAGITTSALAEGIQQPLGIVRAMPNTPMQVGLGMTAWYATDLVTPTQRTLAAAILASGGKQIQLTRESDLDIATAISGSGPAYFFLILEALVDVGVQLGLSRAVASLLAIQTAYGSAGYADQSSLHLAELRNQVTSPGGTTAQGLGSLEKGGIRAVLAEGVLAAYRRAQELGK